MKKTNSVPLLPLSGENQGENLLYNIQILYPKMSKSFKQISSYLLSNPTDITRYSITKLAQKIKTNPSNITRYCQALGYSGFTEFKYRFELSYRTLSEKPANFQLTDPVPIVTQKLRLICNSVFDDALLHIDYDVLECAVTTIMAASAADRRICIFGTGGSNYSAQLAEMMFIQAGIICSSYSNAQLAITAMTQLRQGDVALFLSSSGNAVSSVDCMRKAKAAGATIISITCDANSLLAKNSDIKIVYPSDIRNDIRLFFLLKISELALLGLIQLCIMLRSTSNNSQVLANTHETFFNLRNVY